MAISKEEFKYALDVIRKEMEEEYRNNVVLFDVILRESDIVIKATPHAAMLMKSNELNKLINKIDNLIRKSLKYDLTT